jgi:hypothetical protein
LRGLADCADAENTSFFAILWNNVHHVDCQIFHGVKDFLTKRFDRLGSVPLFLQGWNHHYLNIGAKLLKNVLSHVHVVRVAQERKEELASFELLHAPLNHLLKSVGNEELIPTMWSRFWCRISPVYVVAMATDLRQVTFCVRCRAIPRNITECF